MRGAQLWLLILIAALAVVMLTPGLRRWITLLLLGEKGRARVGQQALARQPDRISLTARPDPPGAEAPRMFADAYAESIAWRKQRGISGDEVAKVGMDESK